MARRLAESVRMSARIPQRIFRVMGATAFALLATPCAAQWGVPSVPGVGMPGVNLHGIPGVITPSGQYVPAGVNPYAFPNQPQNASSFMPWIYGQQNIANQGNNAVVPSIMPTAPKLNADGSVTLSASEIPYVLQQIQFDVSTGFPSVFIVEGTKVVRQDVLVAEEIRFGPNAVLVFDNPFNTPIRIIAKRAVVSPGSRPPLITWNREDSNSALPPPVGKASPGSNGQQEGEPGRKGEPGAPGNLGFTGRSAPAMYVAIQDVRGGQLFFDLRGQNGSSGGPGQSGGDGGAGAPGQQALSSPFDCRRPGGVGGTGGDGGNGGFGGRGGSGGDGGLLVLISAEDSIDSAYGAVRSDVAAGAGGPGGVGGQLGERGSGGAGGRGVAPCGGGSLGQAGNPGTPGKNGAAGSPGTAGRITRVGLNADQMLRLGFIR